MPILLRIILQRLLILVASTMTFFGLSPEVYVLTEEEAHVATEERKEAVIDILQKLDDLSPSLKIEDVVKPKTDVPVQTNPPIVKQVPIQTETPDTQTPFSNEQLKKLTDEVSRIQEDLSSLVKVTTQSPVEESTIANISINIICTNRDGNKINVTTGSGTIISPTGVVITNAHVAQFFLLESYEPKKYECTLKKENIPIFGYRADLLFISENWVRDNYNLINAKAARGTGEGDYALLVITESTNPTFSLPRTFPYTDPETQESEIKIGSRIVVAGYPGFSSNLFNINKSSSVLTDSTTISDVFTFSRTSIDIFSTGETPVGQRGSSGGGVFKNGDLLGMITTTSSGSKYNVINAISLSYINRDLRKETGSSLQKIISGDVLQKSLNFEQNDVPSLLSILIKGL